MIEILQSKIHRAVVTDANINYEGSITISANLIKLVGLHEYQKVLVPIPSMRSVSDAICSG